MRKNLYFLFFIGTLIFSLPAFGQKNVVVVEPDDPLNPGALNRAVEAVDSIEGNNTIFELRRDGLYLLNGSISHAGYTLHIRGEEGTGSKPVLQPAVDETGGSSRQFTPGGSMILEHLYIQGRDELGAINTQPIRVAADSVHIIIDDCVLDYSGQSFVRTNSSGNVVMIMNSVLRNSLLPDNPSNGRIIDSRGNPNDTLWVSNSTIYNNGATQIRSDGGFTLFANFDHNTVYQTSFNHDFALDIIFKANITNNLFYNFLYRGDNTDHEGFFRCDSMFTIGEYSDADRYFDFSNNNWYVQQEIGDILDEFGPDTLYRFDDWDILETDTIWYREALRKNWFADDSILAISPPQYHPPIVNFIANGQVDTTGLFREELTFKNPPPLNLEYWKFFTENGWAIQGSDPPNAYADEDPLVLGEVQEGAFDFSYNINSRSATAADGGLPLGASRWTPYDPAVSVGDVRLNRNHAVRTYPNPFEDQVTFQIESKESSTMKIQIFDLLGKELQTVYETASQGNNEIVVNLEKISQPGVLLYQIQFETSTGQKSISSGKIIRR